MRGSGEFVQLQCSARRTIPTSPEVADYSRLLDLRVGMFDD